MVDGTARRLPSWMIGAVIAASADEGIKSTVAYDKKEKKKKKKQTHSNSTKSKEKKSKENSFSLTKCGTMGKKVDLIKNDAEKRKNGIRRKRNANSDASPSYSDDDEDELTVEDLVSIAEEYVKNEKGTLEKRSLKAEVRLQKNFSAINSSRYDVEGPVIAGHSEQVETVDKTIVESSEQSSLQVSRTEDPAQDMLNLFLGPLLKKPPAEETKIQCLKNDVVFSHKLTNENQHDSREEMLVPSKKKSSLKTKVSILLD